jgi:hypothetical protein
LSWTSQRETCDKSFDVALDGRKGGSRRGSLRLRGVCNGCLSLGDFLVKGALAVAGRETCESGIA